MNKAVFPAPHRRRWIKGKYIMNCPYCGGELVEGEAIVEGTIFGFLFFGLSSQHLWFREKGYFKKERILGSNHKKMAHQCIECGATVIP